MRARWTMPKMLLANDPGQGRAGQGRASLAFLSSRAFPHADAAALRPAPLAFPCPRPTMTIKALFQLILYLH